MRYTYPIFCISLFGLILAACASGAAEPTIQSAATSQPGQHRAAQPTIIPTGARPTSSPPIPDASPSPGATMTALPPDPTAPPQPSPFPPSTDTPEPTPTTAEPTATPHATTGATNTVIPASPTPTWEPTPTQEPTDIPPTLVPTPEPPSPAPPTPAVFPTQLPTGIDSEITNPELLALNGCIHCHDAHPAMVVRMPHPAHPPCNTCHSGSPIRVGCPTCHSTHNVAIPHDIDANLPCNRCHTDR